MGKKRSASSKDKKRELLSSNTITDEKVVRHFRLLSGLPEPESSHDSCKDVANERPDYENRMLMRAAVETLKENKLLRVCRRKKLCLKVPDDKIDHLLNMVQTKSEVQMKSEVGFEELKQVEAAANYIYARKMFKVMQIPHGKMSRVGPCRYGFYV